MADHNLAPLPLGVTFQDDHPFVFQCLKDPGDEGDRFVVSKTSDCFLFDTQGLVFCLPTVSLPALWCPGSDDELLVCLGVQKVSYFQHKLVTELIFGYKDLVLAYGYMELSSVTLTCEIFGFSPICWCTHIITGSLFPVIVEVPFVKSESPRPQM